jgi:DNA primase catalytic subunit
MATDTHDKMIEAFQNYFKWQDRFEWKGSEEAGIKARFWLAEIRRQAHIRRKEIQDKREERRKLRNGKNGRPKNDTY